jgi:hypothetical protein
MTAATSLLDFILRLLKDPQAQAEFRASPEQVLAANGLTDVSAADIRDTLPLVTDNRFVELNGSNLAVSPSVVLAAGGSRIHAAVHYLHHVTRTYRYDDHGAHAHDPAHVNIWATGDVAPTFDDSHVGTGTPFPGPGGAPGTGNWAGDGHGNSGHHSTLIYGDHNHGLSCGDTQDGPAGSPPSSAFRHSSQDLHSFGSGATTTPAGGTGSPAAYSGGTAGSHDSTGFHPADSGGASSQAAPDDYHTHDAHSSFGDSYYGHDTNYGQDSEHGTQDAREPHIYLDLHLFGKRGRIHCRSVPRPVENVPPGMTKRLAA